VNTPLTPRPNPTGERPPAPQPPIGDPGAAARRAAIKAAVRRVLLKLGK